MQFIRNMKDAAVFGRLEDEALHEIAMNEMKSGYRREGLWAKAIISSEGIEAKAASEYLRLLVIALRDEKYLASRAGLDAISQSTNKYKPTIEPEISESAAPDLELMNELGITFDGENFHYKTYRYSKYHDAVNYARLTSNRR